MSINNLHLPDFWKSLDDFDITIFDAEYVLKNPSATKQSTHNALSADLRTLASLLSKDTFWKPVLKDAREQLKSAYQNQTNLGFWKSKVGAFAECSLESYLQEKKQSYSVDRFLTAAIDKKTDQLESGRTPRKRKQVRDVDCVSNSSQSTNSSSNSSGEYHPKRQAKYRHIAKNHEEKPLENDDARWLLGGDVDLTGELMEYRTTSISLDKQKEGRLSDMRVLSLNYVFVLTPSFDTSITRAFLSRHQHSELLKEVKEAPVVLASKARSWALELRTMAIEDRGIPAIKLKAFTSKCITESAEAMDENLTTFADIMHRLVPRLRRKYKGCVEYTFVKDRFADIVDFIFNELSLRHILS